MDLNCVLRETMNYVLPQIWQLNVRHTTKKIAIFTINEELKIKNS